CGNRWCSRRTTCATAHAPATASPIRKNCSGWNASAGAAVTMASIRPKAGLTARITAKSDQQLARRTVRPGLQLFQRHLRPRPVVMAALLGEAAPEQVQGLGAQAPAGADAPFGEQAPRQCFALELDLVVPVFGLAFRKIDAKTPGDAV